MFNVIQKKITVDFFWHKSRNFPNCVAKQPANLIFSWTSFPCMFLNISKFICMRLYVRDIWYRNIKIVITWSWYRDILCEWLKAWMSVSQSDSGWYLWIAEFKVSAKREINIFTIISPRHISSRILWHFATRPPPFPWYILLYIYIYCYIIIKVAARPPPPFPWCRAGSLPRGRHSGAAAFSGGDLISFSNEPHSFPSSGTVHRPRSPQHTAAASSAQF